MAWTRAYMVTTFRVDEAGDIRNSSHWLPTSGNTSIVVPPKKRPKGSRSNPSSRLDSPLGGWSPHNKYILQFVFNFPEAVTM